MKIKTRLLGLMMSALTLVATSASADVSIVLNNGDDDVPLSELMKSENGAKALVPLNARIGTDSIVIASLPPSTSPDLNRSRVNAMIGLGGGNVPTDRTQDAAAWHVVSADPAQPERGLQWFDIVTTSFPSWLGTTNTAFTGQRGHRIVIHATGNGPVSNYVGTVSTTLTNAGLNASYPVHLNTTTMTPNVTGPNFVIIYYGPDRQKNTSVDTITGRYIAGGDDIVYDSGQVVSSIPAYDAWARFGATAVINAGTLADFESVRNQFAIPQTITAGLQRTDTGSNVVASIRTAAAALPRVHTAPNGTNMLRLWLSGGQQGLAYGIQSNVTLATNGWTTVPSVTIFSGGSPVDLPSDGVSKFFRAFAR